MTSKTNRKAPKSAKRTATKTPDQAPSPREATPITLSIDGEASECVREIARALQRDPIDIIGALVRFGANDELQKIRANAEDRESNATEVQMFDAEIRDAANRREAALRAEHDKLMRLNGWTTCVAQPLSITLSARASHFIRQWTRFFDDATPEDFALTAVEDDVKYCNDDSDWLLGRISDSQDFHREKATLK